MFSLELGSEVANLTCDCCGKPFKSVCGFIKKDDWAYSAYFATLQTGHDKISVGLTVSIGKWWDDSDEAIQQREWVYMYVWPSEAGTGFDLRVEEPNSLVTRTARCWDDNSIPNTYETITSSTTSSMFRISSSTTILPCCRIFQERK